MSAQELWSNKDLIHSISAFMSLKQLDNFRKVCKQYYEWLSDAAGFAWNQRVKSSFPFSFQSVLKEDMKSQIARLRKFDTLVYEGNQVSFFEWPEALAVRHFAQLPWSRHLFVIICNNGDICVFDSRTGARNFQPTTPTCRSWIMFDLNSKYNHYSIKTNMRADHKIGIWNRETGVMRLFAVDGMTLKHEADFTSQVLRSRLINQIYGDHVIATTKNSLEWYSLTTNKLVKTLEFSDFEEMGLNYSLREPLIYVGESFEQSFKVWEIDGDVNSETPKKLLFERTKKGKQHGQDGVLVNLNETDNGRILYTSLSEGNDFYDVFDLTARQFTHHKVESLFRTMDPNPGTPFYTFLSSSRVFGRGLAILDDTFHDDWLKAVWTDRTARTHRLIHGLNREDADRERTEGAYFEFFNVEVEWSEWLSSDILTLQLQKMKSVTTPEEYFPRQLFFSIKNRRVIGHIDEDIRAIFASENQVLAFSSIGFYLITWNPELVPTFGL